MSISWKKYTSLARKKIRERERKFIVEGVRLCNEALLSDWEAEVAFVTQAFTESHHWEQLEELLRQKGIPYRVLREENFQRLTDTKTPQGVLMVMSMFDFRIDQIDWHKTKFVICLDGIRDPGNLGTLIRTADWYGVQAIFLSLDCVDQYNSKVLRGSMGSIFHVPIFSSEDIVNDIDVLKGFRFNVTASTVYGKQILGKTRFKAPTALVLGGEAQGVSPRLINVADRSVRIWRYGQAESLNVAVAGGVLMNQIANHIFE